MSVVRELYLSEFILKELPLSSTGEPSVTSLNNLVNTSLSIAMSLDSLTKTHKNVFYMSSEGTIEPLYLLENNPYPGKQTEILAILDSALDQRLTEFINNQILSPLLDLSIYNSSVHNNMIKESNSLFYERPGGKTQVILSIAPDVEKILQNIDEKLEYENVHNSYTGLNLSA